MLVHSGRDNPTLASASFKIEAEVLEQKENYNFTFEHGNEFYLPEQRLTESL